jgi:hypothetical protein
MPALSEHVNVDATALHVLRAKGFQLWYDESLGRYGAERDGWDFLAESPCALLGLVAIYEHVAPAQWTEYWWRLARECSTLPAAPQPFVAASPQR